MATARPIDSEKAALELLHLERDSRRLDQRIDQIRDRNATFPSQHTAHQLDELVAEQATMRERMSELQRSILSA